MPEPIPTREHPTDASPECPVLPPSSGERIFRSLSAVAEAAAGIALIFSPPLAVQNNALSIVSFLIGLFMTSGLIAAFGAFRYKFMTEYICQSLLIPALFALFICLASWSFSHPGSIFMAAVTFAFLLKKIARFAALHRLVDSYKMRGR